MLIKNTQNDLIEGVMKFGPEILNSSISDAEDIKDYLQRVYEEKLQYPLPPQNINHNNWFLPDEYKNLDIEKFLVDQCPVENRDRLLKELELYHRYDMINVLRAMKYIVDTLRKHNVVWGVGRGSSVASYTLYLIGVHKIDSVKYAIPIEEFFKGEKNG